MRYTRGNLFEEYNFCIIHFFIFLYFYLVLFYLCIGIVFELFLTFSALPTEIENGDNTANAQFIEGEEEEYDDEEYEEYPGKCLSRFLWLLSGVGVNFASHLNSSTWQKY